ncbi:NACHT domain-containing protein [Streptomyces venezuelae]|uniref:NACHT domain-containing protein n=1 Tax=Streptomyces venezuelae TaxID=54571 RepID=UPI00278C6B89|nr:XRE family transcriptional regulator [Streptomyces venezuelae]
MRALGQASADLSEALRAARLRTGASARALAGVLGQSALAVHEFEHGDRVPPEGLLAAYATAVDLDEVHLRQLWRAAAAESEPWTEASRDLAFERVYADFLLANRPGFERTDPSPSHSVFASPSDVPVTDLVEALAAGGRVVLRGHSGSGRTTYLHRLAVEAAYAIRHGQRTSAVSRVPFLIRVPEYGRGRELPRPADLLQGHGGERPVPEPPDGWSERLLAAGRGMILVDGLDEVPPDVQDRVGAWLTYLLSLYPSLACLVAAGTEPGSPQWLESLGFAEFRTGPMGFADVRRFVHEWPKADDRVPGERWDAFLEAVETSAGLRELMTTPVMCGAVCALFEGTHGRLPISRSALCETLLPSSEPSRDAGATALGEAVARNLSAAQQKAALRGIALSVLRNGTGRATHQQVLHQIHVVLGSRYDDSDEAEAVLWSLLSRSGMLTTSGRSDITFVHPVFVSYLAAGLFLDPEGFHELVDQAHDVHWRDTVVLATELAARRERAELIRAILHRADAEPEHRTELRLVAAEAAAAVPELDPDIRDEVVELTAAVIPPRSEQAAVELARFGPRLIDLFPRPDDVQPDDPYVPLLVRAAELIGGEVAEAYRARLLEGVSYGQPVRRRPPLPSYALETWDHPAAARPRPPEGDTRRAVLLGSDPLVPTLRDLPDLHTLVIEDNPLLTELGALTTLTKLRTLVITRCPRLGDLTSLRNTGVMFLQLDTEPDDDQITALASSPRLRALYLPRVKAAFDAARLGRRLPGVSVLGRQRIRA